MEKLVAWYRSRSAPDQPPDVEGCGDWLQPYTLAKATPEDRMGDRRGDTPLPLIGMAFHARSARVLADAARVLKYTSAEAAEAHANTVRMAFAQYYFDGNARLKNAPETQTAYALAIAFELLPPAFMPLAGAHLARLVRKAGGHLRTGFLGTPYLTHALDKTGHACLACDLLFQESYPSWFYPIHQGATTMWERWNSYSHEYGFGDATMNSFNHYAYGAIGQWMYERLAGLTPDPANPGYKHFFVRPLFAPQLDYMHAWHDTPYGRAGAFWERRQDDRITLELIVPPNTTATLDLAAQCSRQTVPAGSHRFELKSASKLFS